MQKKAGPTHRILVYATRNNYKMYIYTSRENKPIYRLTTRNTRVKTKKKLSTFCLAAMCNLVGRFIRKHKIPLLFVQWRGVRKFRKFTMRRLCRVIVTKQKRKRLIRRIWALDNIAGYAFNGCRGVHMQRK